MPSVAVIGASNDRRKFGNKCVRAFLEEGYEVFPVNPREPEIEGRKVYRSVADIPEELDIVSIYLPPPSTLAALSEIAEKGVREIVYLNPGSADLEVDDRARELGLPIRHTCSIRALGRSPGEFP